jgi:phosphoesterase RecJ-like protein
MYEDASKVNEIVEAADKVVIVQADNPDADSLGSALALESILGEMGKEPYLYCGVDIPNYLKYLPGWDRVQSDLPNKFDASLIVDASTMTLLERLVQSGQQGWLAGKPCAVLDHHQTVENIVPFATVIINDPERASAGELIYILAKQLGWPLPLEAQQAIMNSILGDTQGLSNSLASSETYRIIAEMIDSGVSRPELEEVRREYGKMAPEIFKYKAELIKRADFMADGKLAYVTITQAEINKYSPLYNPAPLIQGDMLQTSGVLVAIVFKRYDDGKVLGAIRSNQSAPVAAEIAVHMGGGGHVFASGFKTLGRPFEEVKTGCLNFASELLAKIGSDETI